MLQPWCVLVVTEQAARMLVASAAPRKPIKSGWMTRSANRAEKRSGAAATMTER